MADAPVLASIAIITSPDKTDYVTGEALDLTGLVVTGTYDDESGKAETVTLANVSGYSQDTPGEQILTVTVDGVTATFTVTVCVLDSIAVTSLPSKQHYAVGEELDTVGLEVTGTFTYGTTSTTRIIPEEDLLLSDFSSVAPGSTTVTVEYQDGYGNEETTAFTLQVVVSRQIIINLDDPVTGLPEDLTLSKTGTGASATATLTLEKPYAEYGWYVNGSSIAASSTASLTLNAANLPSGKNILTVEVKSDQGLGANGAFYAKEYSFMVTR
jgi:hypothetical protein